MKLRNKKTGEIVTAFDLWLIEYNDNIRLSYYDAENRPQVYVTDSLKSFDSMWEDAPEEPKEYWCIDVNGAISCEQTDDGCEFDNDCREIGNYFETEEEAEKAVEKLKALKRLKDKGIMLHLQKQFQGDGIGYSRTIYTDFCKDSEEIVKDLDLLFGGEE